MSKLNEYVQINQAAGILGVCRNTLRNWGRTGKIPEQRHPVNNYRLVKVSDLERVLAEPEGPRRRWPANLGS